MISQTSIDRLVNYYKSRYRKNIFKWSIGQYIALNREDETQFGEHQLARKKALFDIIESVPKGELESYKELLIGRRNTTDDLKDMYRFGEKIEWLAYYLFCGESMPGKSLPEKFQSIYDLGEELYSIMEEYLISMLRDNTLFFFEANARIDINSDIENWVSEKSKEGYEGSMLVRKVVDQVMDSYWRAHFTSMPKKDFEGAFINYVEAVQPISKT